MKELMPCIIGLVVAVAATGVPKAQSAPTGPPPGPVGFPITVEFSGEITSIGAALTNDNVSVGDSVYGRFTYDLFTPDLFPSFDYYGRYSGESFEIALGDSFFGISINTTISVQNDRQNGSATLPADGMTAEAEAATGDMLNGRSIQKFQFGLRRENASGQLWPDDGLPDLDVWANVGLRDINAPSWHWMAFETSATDGSIFDSQIRWNITSFSVMAGRGDPPVADAGGPYIADATGWDGTTLTLDGSNSYDPDEDSITYEWDLDLSFDSDLDGNPSNDVDETASVADYIFPIGQTEIALVVRDDSGLASEPDVATVTVGFTGVAVDIKPGSYPNVINLMSKGVIPVTFLSDDDFDALTIDPTTVTLVAEDFDAGLVKMQGKKDPKPMATAEDVDGDGYLDLLVKIDTEKLNGYELGSMCEFGALTYDGFLVSGADSVQIVPSKK